MWKGRKKRGGGREWREESRGGVKDRGRMLSSSYGGGLDCLSPRRGYEGCSRRISETKHDGSEKSPLRASQRKGSSHSEGGREVGGGREKESESAWVWRRERGRWGGSEITHLLVWIESGKSEFLRALVATQPGKWSGNFRERRVYDRVLPRAHMYEPRRKRERRPQSGRLGAPCNRHRQKRRGGGALCAPWVGVSTQSPPPPTFFSNITMQGAVRRCLP